MADGGRGRSRRIEAATSAGLPSGKGREPTAISCRRTPNEKTSLFGSTGSPRSCSGDMYGIVPTKEIPVNAPSTVASSTAVSSPGRDVCAIPKSRTFT